MDIGISVSGNGSCPVWRLNVPRRVCSKAQTAIRATHRQYKADFKYRRGCQTLSTDHLRRRDHDSSVQDREQGVCGCSSTGAASVSAGSCSPTGFGRRATAEDESCRSAHAAVSGALYICLALGLAVLCAVSGRSQTGFASLALSSSTVTKEGLRAVVRSAWAGLGAGFLHTLSGPDHLAALTPLTIGRSNFKATLLGALWGFGHSIGQLILGLLMVVLKDRFTQLVPALTKYGSTTVGLTLLVIGIAGLYETWMESAEVADQAQPVLSGAGVSNAAAEPAGLSSGASGPDKVKVAGNLHTLFTGIVFGLQPDALFVIVPALALPTKLAAMAYILMFVFGTVAAMGSYTAFIGATSSAMQKNYSGLCAKLSAIASVAAVAIGLAILAGGWGIQVPFL